MSEAMSSVEIEDVLSSIRRLVSEDLRPGNRPVARKPDDKLILTPAFRVIAEPVSVPQPVTFETAPRPSTLPRLHLGAEPETERLAASLERAVEAQDIEWESEVGDPAPLVAEMEWTDAGWSAVAAAQPVIAKAEVAVTPSWAQDDPEQDSSSNAEPSHDAPIAEPDENWADKAEAEAVAELQGGTTQDDSIFGSSAADMSFDELVLRNLVRDLIGEELQGALGERITRNVRKLVRAEIARALAAQELD